ncbi:MAG: bifunctional diaminohydroxyphosphoribosylaminopyrimidine deaminase/5-amino-6-(5-phosphoribosylamino)uracil reductase RibD [Pirellulales bacterium]
MPDKELSTDVSFSADDHQWMQLALDLARRGLGHVEPNPMVGCCLVREGNLIESGYHAKFGQAHAERAAILAALEVGKADQIKDCTAYVTLEPCCHHGKTPPCTDLLIEVGVSRVVIAMQDPFGLVQGKGIQQLRSAGIQVDIGLEQTAAQLLNSAYLKRLSQGKPWVIAKWAMSLDGRIASSKGHSQWISCEESRDRVHLLRGRMDAIIVGSRTAKTDDPMLTPRPKDAEPPRLPLRVVIDSACSLSVSSKLAQSATQFPDFDLGQPRGLIASRRPSARTNWLSGALESRRELCRAA